MLAALLRFWQLGHQALWLNESFTWEMMNRPLGGMLHQIGTTETTPPLFYVLEWLWTRLVGTSPAGLRSLSALLGIAAVPVVWRVGREALSVPAGLIAAALVAVGPYFVWFSQEARSYELLVLISSLSLLALLRALREPRPRALAVWAIVAALALATHYFAAFLIAPQAVWLLWRVRTRAAVAALGAVAVVGLALLPLALAQRGHTNYISELGFARRVEDTPKKFVTGELGTPTPLIGPLAGLLVVAGAALALAPGRRRAEPAWVLAALAALAVGLPIVLALLGTDLLVPENAIGAFPPLALLVGAGLARAGARWGAAAAVALCALMLVVDIEVQRNPSLQRDDWRSVAHTLAPRAALPRAVVLSPSVQEKPFRLYAGQMPSLPAAGAAVRELDLVGYDRPPGWATPPAPPGFRLASATRKPSSFVVRYQALSPVAVSSAQLAALHLPRKGGYLLLYQDRPLRGGP